MNCIIQFFFFNYLFFWLCWVFIAAWAFLQLRQAGATLQLCQVGATLQLRCVDFLMWWLLLLQSMGCREHGLQQLQHVDSVVVASGPQCTGSIVMAQGLSCSTAFGIFPGQGSNWCLLHWQVDLFTTEPPEKPLQNVFVICICICICVPIYTIPIGFRSKILHVEFVFFVCFGNKNIFLIAKM